MIVHKETPVVLLFFLTCRGGPIHTTGPMLSLREDGKLDAVTRLADGTYTVHLQITSSFLRGDGLAFTVTGHGTNESECKSEACFKAPRKNTKCVCDVF